MREDPLEEEMATHSSILAWRTPWTEEPGGATVNGVAKSPSEQLTLSHSLLYIDVYSLINRNEHNFVTWFFFNM